MRFERILEIEVATTGKGFRVAEKDRHGLKNLPRV